MSNIFFEISVTITPTFQVSGALFFSPAEVSMQPLGRNGAGKNYICELV